MTHNENDFTEFTAGQKVRSVYGETLTVTSQNGCMVFVAERQAHYPPSKLFPAFDSQTARQRVGGTFGS